MEPGFVKASSDNLPRIDACMMALFFRNNNDFIMAEVRGEKPHIICDVKTVSLLLKNGMRGTFQAFANGRLYYFCGKMNIDFAGKRALVTGAGKGIGKAVAIKLAECGAQVVAVSRTKSDLDELEQINPNITTVCLDIGNWESTKSVIENVGPIDLLVNNAGILENKPYGDLSEEEVNKTFDVNVKAIINISQIIAEGMKSRGSGGSIVNVSSIFSYVVSSTYSNYCTSKGAVDQITRCMAVEFGPYNIRVNAVNPTVIRTKMSIEEGMYDPDNEYAIDWLRRTPLKRFGEVDEVAYPILFLLSDKASLITGIAMPIDGGLTISF